METISIVFPVWNEAENLDTLYQRVVEACREARVEPELIFVDNSSTDESLTVIKQLRVRDRRVGYVSLSRNFGHQNALFAGMSFAKGQAVITMDADLQHPPVLIPQMVQQWRQGVEVVYTTKIDSALPWRRRCSARLFYWVISKLSGLQLTFGQTDFRLLDRKVLEVLLRIPEYHKFLRGQIKWVGFRQEGLSYNVEPRLSGTSKFSYRHLLAFALDGIVAFSRYPLRLVTIAGLITFAFSVIYIGYILLLVGLKLLQVSHLAPFPPGWMTLATAVLCLGSLQLVALGVLGEYIGRIYDQTKGRPVFIVREQAGASFAS